MRPRSPWLPAMGAAAALGAAALYRGLVRTTVTTERGRIEILDPADDSVLRRSGAVGSVQEAEIRVERAMLERIWTPAGLEQLARGYWAFLRSVTLGIVRVIYAPDQRTVTLLGRIPLLRFGAPRYEAADDAGQVTWPIVEGLLVAREGRGHGHLRVAVRRCDQGGVGVEPDAADRLARVVARVEVQNFYPGLRGRGAFARFGTWLYAQTQLRVHVIVCNAYLLSLAKLHFPDLEAPGGERAPQLETSGP